MQRSAATRLAPPRRRCAPLLAACLLAACSGREQAAAPAALAAGQAAPLEAEGVRFQARAFADGRVAAASFGFDAAAAGLLPVRVSLANRGGETLKIMPRLTFLVDWDGRAWPLLTAEQAAGRLGRAGIQAPAPVRAAGRDGLDALTGFALDMVEGAAFAAAAEASAKPDGRAARNFAAKTQRNPGVAPGRVASGVLFFPGQAEARGARALRLGYEQGGRVKFLLLPLDAAAPLAAAP